MWWGIIRTPRVTNVFVDMASGSSFESESLSATSHEADALSTLDESQEDEEGSSSFSEVAPDPVLSLLSKLKSPRTSDLARKRRVAANPPKGKRPCRGSNFCPLEWWRRNCGDLPIWSACARKVLLVQPSSAASERVFSMLKASFHDQQDNSLQDYIESSLMLQYNDH